MAIKSRRKAREVALRVLYQMEIAGEKATEALKAVLEETPLPSYLSSFGEELVRGVLKNQREIDKRLQDVMKDWTLDRLATIDRNVMRVAVFELLFCPGIPPKVTLNEAIEISKKYSTAESGKFVNGVLAAVLEGTEKSNWNPETAPAEFGDESEEEPEEEPIEIEEIEVDEEEATKVARVGGWTIRRDDERTDS